MICIYKSGKSMKIPNQKIENYEKLKYIKFYKICVYFTV